MATMPRRASILSSRVRRSRLDHTSPSRDLDGERYGEEAGGGVHEDAYGLERVSHDIFGLGVGLGLLM